MKTSTMAEKIFRFAENYGNAFIVAVYSSKEIIYTNKTASQTFGVTTETANLDTLFVDDTDFMSVVVDALTLKDLEVLNNVEIYTVQKKIVNCDIQFGFFDEDSTEVFIEITPKADTRMEIAMAQVNQSTRAESILEFDDKLSLIHCNQLFHEVFHTTEDTALSHFSLGFQPELREDLLAEIHANLQKSDHFVSRMKVITSTGTELWYSMELHRRTLDDSGVDKIMAYMINIERDVQIESDLENINQYFLAVQELSDDLLYRIDIKNKTLLGREKTNTRNDLFSINVITKNFPESVCENGFVHPEDVKTYNAFGHLALEGRFATAEVRLKSKSGKYTFRRISCVPVLNADGSVKEMLGKVVNIHEVRQLEKQALYDDLTGILNKSALLEATTNFLETSKEGETHGLLFLDLDDFTKINKEFGRGFGDFLLKETGRRLTLNTKEKDLVGRVGEDEFVVLFKSCKGEGELKERATLLLESLNQDYSMGNYTSGIKSSIGMAIFPQHGEEVKDLFHQANIALFHSKRTGKNNATLFSQELLKKEKPFVPSLLIGQLVATARLLEENEKEVRNPEDNSLTVAEIFFHDIIEKPESTLKLLESRLMPRRQEIEKVVNKQLIREMKLIYKIKDQYRVSDEQALNDEDFFKGYHQQLKKYYD